MAVQIRHVTRSTTGQWFVINTSPPSGSPTIYTVMEGTEAQAQAYGGGYSGPYTTLAAADQVAAGRPPNAAAPGPLPGTSISPGGGISASNPLTGLAAIGDFFQRLTQASTWLRVGEVLLGAILIGVAMARITHAPNAISKAVKAVPL
jgi:hypothetical protein